MKRADHEAGGFGEKKKKKKKRSRRHDSGGVDDATVVAADSTTAAAADAAETTQSKRPKTKERTEKKEEDEEKQDPLLRNLKKALGPVPSIKMPTPIASSAAPPPTSHHQQQRTDWLKEQEIFHNFVPQSVEAHIMFLNLATRTLCGDMQELAEAVTIPLRSYKTPAERIVTEAVESRRRLPEAEALVELLSMTRDLHTNMAAFIKGMDKCTHALLALHKSVQELATKSHARMRNITAHTFNSIIFSANTPGSSLLTVPTVPQ